MQTKGQPTKVDAVQKLYVMGKRIGWACSGRVGVIQRITAELDKHEGDITRGFEKSHEAGANEIHKRVNEMQKRIHEETVGDKGATVTEYLFAGFGKEGP